MGIKKYPGILFYPGYFKLHYFGFPYCFNCFSHSGCLDFLPVLAVRIAFAASAAVFRLAGLFILTILLAAIFLGRLR